MLQFMVTTHAYTRAFVYLADDTNYAKLVTKDDKALKKILEFFYVFYAPLYSLRILA